MPLVRMKILPRDQRQDRRCIDHLEPVGLVEVEAEPEVEEMDGGALVGQPRQRVVAVGEPEVPLLGPVQVPLHEHAEHGVAHPRLPERVHPRQPVQHRLLLVVRQDRREQHRQRAAGPVPGHQQPRLPVRLQELLQRVADRVVRVHLRAGTCSRPVRYGG